MKYHLTIEKLREAHKMLEENSRDYYRERAKANQALQELMNKLSKEKKNKDEKSRPDGVQPR